MKQPLFFLGLLMALPASAQQAPIPDPRIEVALSTTVIKEAERSVAPEKTLPQPGVRAQPRVEEPDMAKMREGVYVERRLVPPRRVSDDPEAVRVRPSDR